MDLLTHLLHEAGVVRRLLDQRALAAHGALRFPCERSLGLHVAVHGTIWVHAPSLPEPLALQPGDTALMARGCTHLLATTPVPPVAVRDVMATAPETPPPAADATHLVISGAYQLWHAPVHPLFHQLPAWHVVRAADLAPLDPLPLAVGLLRGELAAPQLGSHSVLHGLLDVIFAHLLRRLLQGAGAGSVLPLATGDLPVHEALTLLHGEPAHPWTLETLAAAVRLSRTAFAERFRLAVGAPPLHYLRTIRMQRAMRLLTDSTRSLEQVAQAVGYRDAFAFSKVFKRTVGVSPRDFRRRDAAERGLPHRFSAA